MISYYLLAPILWFISILPIKVLYFVSDIAYWIIYKLIGYRTEVVTTNIQRSFPTMRSIDQQHLKDAFYHHFCDYIVETMKLYSISFKSLQSHIRFTDEAYALLKKYEQSQQSYILVMGHLGNWEWAGAIFSGTSKTPLNAVYHPLHNKGMDKIMRRLRTRFGSDVVPMKETLKTMIKTKNEGVATVLLADQTPPPDGAHWTTFLNQETPIFNGTEKISQKLNLPIIYGFVYKVGRGQYVIECEELITDPRSYNKGEIADIYTQRIEKDIIRQPYTWLWSHKRWKHKRKH